MNKNRISDLALFGGAPAFAEVLHVGRPNIADRDRFLARVNDMLDRRWLTNNGPFVQELERTLASLLGVRHCVALCNATAALEITARALGLQGEVIVPSFTFIATAHALQWQGITPVFCDVDPRTHNIDPSLIEPLLTPRTQGVLAVHVWGRPCDVDALEDLARRHGLKLMFDAAHALSCTYRGTMVGGFGDAEVFSFHATKFFNTFEGGAVATNSDELAANIRLMRNFGFAGLDQVVSLGTNAKMSEVAAAMGLTSLEGLERVVEVNRANYASYLNGLRGIRGLTMVQYDEAEKNNYQYVILEVDAKAGGIRRDLLLQLLEAENVRARRYFYPGCHQMEPYRSLYPEAAGRLPATEALTQKVLQLPTGTALGEAEVARICEIIRFILANAGAILEKVKSQESPARGARL